MEQSTLKCVRRGQIKRKIIEFKDILGRFGRDWPKQFIATQISTKLKLKLTSM